MREPTRMRMMPLINSAIVIKFKESAIVFENPKATIKTPIKNSAVPK
jgi:hypothetical protein